MHEGNKEEIPPESQEKTITLTESLSREKKAAEAARAEAFEEAAKIFNEEAERLKNTPCKEAVHVAIAFAGQKGAAMLCEKLAKAARAQETSGGDWGE